MKVITIGSPSFNPCDSYGRIADELSGGFQRLGYVVSEMGQGGRTSIIPAWGGLLLAYPTNFAKLFHVMALEGRKVAITMFESTVLPEGWATVLNQCDAVIVPARFLVEVFRNSGVTAPIHVVPLGVSAEFCHVAKRQRVDNRPLTFLCIGDRGDRKNALGAMQAFYRAFGDDMRYRLIVKTRFGKMSRMTFTNPNIEMLAVDMDNAQLAELYHQCDVMIFPSKGEGFGLPPREFSATGGVALATAWGGTADDIQHWGNPLAFTYEPAWADTPKWAGQLGVWAKPSLDVMVNVLRDVARRFDVYAERAVEQGKWVAENYRWDMFTSRVHDIWSEAHASHSK